MAVEGERGCGFREVGGLYLVGPPEGRPCCRLPSPIVPCELCGRAVEVQMRGITWESPNLLMAGSRATCVPSGFEGPEVMVPSCPMVTPSVSYGEKVALMWVGTRYYTPESFAQESSEVGVSKRLPAVPKGWDFQNPPWVFLAHPHATYRGYEHRWRVFRTSCRWSDWEACSDPLSIEGGGPEGLHGTSQKMVEACLAFKKTEADVRWEHRSVFVPGIFLVFKPTAIELIVTPSTLRKRRVKKLLRMGVKPVEVPEGDPDHDPKARRRLEREARRKERLESVQNVQKLENVETLEKVE